MYFNPDGVLMTQRDDRAFWDNNNHISYKAALWFPPNWITIPIAAYRRKLKEMQALHYDE